jgi:putative nucleotidyltransferase with HDIG domain
MPWLLSMVRGLLGLRPETPPVKRVEPKVEPRAVRVPAAAASPAADVAPALPAEDYSALDASEAEFAQFASRSFHVAGPEEALILERVSTMLESGKFHVPVLPDVQVKALEIANNPSASAQAIADVIKRDGAVATEVISMVNSAAYCPSTKITDLHRAVVHVGVKRVRGLLFGVAMRMTVFRKGDAKRARQLWVHSMGTAVAAREIAKVTRQDPEEAFLAGLMHDVGKTVILGLLADEEKGRKGPGISETLLWDLLEGGHTAAGAAVAKSWSLMPVLAEVVQHHHLLTPQSSPTLAVVTLADLVCRRHGIGVPPMPVKFSDNPAFTILGLSVQGALDLLQALPEKLANDRELAVTPA